jgi:hypothetical protein
MRVMSLLQRQQQRSIACMTTEQVCVCETSLAASSGLHRSSWMDHNLPPPPTPSSGTPHSTCQTPIPQAPPSAG